MTMRMHLLMKRCEHKGCNHNMEAEGNSNGNGNGNGNGKRLSWQSIVCNLQFTSIEGRRTSVHEGPVCDNSPMAISVGKVENVQREGRTYRLPKVPD